MNCSEVKQLIQLYMDSELEARDTLEVQRHLEACPSCDRALHVLTDQDEKLRTAARAEAVVGATLRDRVVRTIREQERPSRLKGRRPLAGLISGTQARMLARVAAVVVAAAAVVFALLMTGVLRGPGNGRVYAEAIEDHQDHCMLENTADRMYTEAADIDRLTRHCKISAPMDLSSLGLTEPRARLCGLEGEAYLHLLYFKLGGQSPGYQHQGISFFVRVDDSAVEAPLRMSHKSELYVGSVSKPGVRVVVVSPFSEDETRRATLLALSQLTASH